MTDYAGREVAVLSGEADPWGFPDSWGLSASASTRRPLSVSR